MTIKKLVESVKEEVEALKGHQTKDKRFQSEYTYPDEQTARQAFERATEKLFAVNVWSNLTGLTATFLVHDQAGNPKTSPPLAVGDYLRIDLPGPLPQNWVRVVQINQGEEAAEFTVEPSEKPLDNTSGHYVEHFFTAEATSTFRVERQGTRLVASEIGRNERVNNDETSAGQRTVVNTLIAAGGWAVFQETQWKKLTDYLVDGKPLAP
ncbi:hypothetical protein ACFSUS_20150 [Spirosoma soli]|uniref:Uncharacterized protein n=1 Tax=Spirosoma soli TaxID=1770529 RepID=A0ABW5M986_9BACT